MKWVWSTLAEIHSVISDKGGVWSTNDEKQFVSSLVWEGFGQHKLRYI
jgi:hypothetical protein